MGHDYRLAHFTRAVIVMTLNFLYSTGVEHKNGCSCKSKTRGGGFSNYFLKQQAEKLL
jgi:hypothetical protein